MMSKGLNEYMGEFRHVLNKERFKKKTRFRIIKTYK